ncbi:hypothetical protein [Moraxella marmotae]|uniref:hypothetical protein n=1 Tax=Moraxella marmotae TaxID=3344520 RepID=UPI0035F433D8
MSVEDRLSFVNELVEQTLDDGETLAVLHELFFQEVHGQGDETVIDAIAMAIAQFVDPEVLTQIGEHLGSLGVDLPAAFLPQSQSKPKRTRKKASKADDTTAQDGNADSTDTAPKKRRARKKITNSETDNSDNADGLANDTVAADSASDIDHTATPKKRRKRAKKTKNGFVQEALLEFIEEPSGAMTLREVGTDEALVSIAFSEQVKDMLGNDARIVGQAMIHAAIASVVQRQSNFWHAHVYDEEPVHYS